MESGMIFNIQRYSLHDGPGIRTTVFLKGCPLKCWWCHNPEGIFPGPELHVQSSRCAGCATCVTVCPTSAIALRGSIAVIDRGRCCSCLQCREACPRGAIELIGREVTTGEVLAEVLKDRLFFDESGGGVTISGGEPLMQADFLISLLRAFKDAGIHTAVDTSGSADWDVLEHVATWTDLFLFDLKLIDSQKSLKYIGVDSARILDNLRKLVQLHSNILIRIPIIPTINDDAESISVFGRYLQTLGLRDVSVLPYHNTAMGKYARAGLEYKLPDIEPPSQEAMAAIRDTLSQYGLTGEE